MNTIQKTAFLGMAVAALSACASTEEHPRTCPQLAIVRDLERVRDYGQDTAGESTLVAEAKMEKIKGSCTFTSSGVDIDFDLAIKAGKGTRLGRKVSFPFFVSVIDPEQRPVFKEMMTTSFEFDPDDKIKDNTEELHVFIPMDTDADSGNYQVLAGFQLTEEQLKEARSMAGK